MRILGIEFGTWSVKAVEMESRFRRLDILDFHEVRLPLQMLDPVAEYRQALEQLIARLPSHADKIATSIPPSQTALRFLQVPIKQRKTVEKMYRFELEDNIPFKLDDSLIEHHVYRLKEGSLVFAAVAPKKHLQAHLEWLKTIGVDPDWLTFDGMGLINLYFASLQENPDEMPADPVLLLDMGHTKTNMAIIHQDRLEQFRSISWGGASITQSIALGLGVSPEEAEQCKMNDLRLDVEFDDATPELQEMVVSASQAFTPFIADVTHSIVAYRTKFSKEIKTIKITGGTSKIWGIESLLTNSLHLPIEKFLPFAGVSIKEQQKESADEARFGESLGRALVFARKSQLLFNFRKQDLAKETQLNEVGSVLKDPNILRLMKYAGILLGVLFIHVFIAQQLADSESKAATEDLRKTFQETFKSVPPKLRNGLTANPNDLKKFIGQKNKEMEQKLKMLAKVRVPMMSLLLSISNAFPPDVRVDVNTLQLDDRSFNLDGVLYKGDLTKVTETMKAIKSLSNVTLTKNGQRFTYHGDVVGR
jgi:type IV pilus assembly protein PilM